MLIRQARPDEAPIIREFQLAMARETEALELDQATVDRGVRAVFGDPSKGTYYVAESEGEVVASLLTTYEWSDWRAGTVLWIQSVYVRPAMRRRGVYSAMYRHIRQLVEGSPDLKGIRLYAETTNLTAHRVYEQSGMTADHYQLYEWLK